MGEKVRRFINRSPRYVLRPEDRNTLRFRLSDKNGKDVLSETTMLNLSESGVAFLMAPSGHPKIGDLIKVEIPIPNGEQIAWFGRVVHVREYSTSRWRNRNNKRAMKPQVLVGVHFEKLPEGHSRALRRGIDQSFIKAMQDQKYRNLIYYRKLFFQFVPNALFYFLLTLAAVGFIYYFSQPDQKYDGKRGTPWGERFKF